jgi:sec-independent protein translocase protein TatC
MSDQEERLSPREMRRLRQMTFWSHVEELRKRLGRSVIGVLAGTAIGAVFAKQAMALFLSPIEHVQAVALHPTESFVVYFRVAILLGIVIAMPYLVYQFMAFFVPALKKNERRILFVSVVAIGAFFATGVVFAGFVMVPLAVGYLSGFLADVVEPTYSIDGYISFVTTIMLSTGLVFQTPLVLALAARLGLVTSKQLSKNRRYALLVIALLAAVITPTPDAFNMMIVMAPLLVLYELGIFLAWLAGKARARAQGIEAATA